MVRCPSLVETPEVLVGNGRSKERRYDELKQ